MATDLAELGLSVDSRGFVRAERDLDKFDKTAGRTGRTSEKLAKQARQLGKAFLVFGTAAAGATAASLKLAIDAEETANKFRVVFRGSVVETNAALTELTKSIPATRSQLQGFAAGVQDLLVPLGLVREEAAGLSTDAVRVAGDLASFNNVGIEDTLNAIKSALAGSSEPMRRFGVDTRETRLQALALNEGLVQQGEDLSQAARAQAVFIALQRDSADALGDAARTADDTANAIRFIGRDVRQLSEDFGRTLLPAVQILVSELKNVSSETDSLSGVLEGSARAILVIAEQAVLLSGIFVELGKRIGQAAAILVEFSKAAQLDFEFSDLFVPGAALGRFIDSAGDLAGIGERLNAINQAAAEDVDGLRQSYFDVAEAIRKARGEIGKVTDEQDEAVDAAANLAKEQANIAEESESAAEAITKSAQAAEEYTDILNELRRELQGPLGSALAEFGDDVQNLFAEFQQGNITFGEFQEGLDLAGQVLESRTNPEIERLFDNVNNLLQQGLPEFAQQMLGIAQASEQAANGFSAFSRIGSNFAQSIINGQSIRGGLESSLIGFGGQGIADLLSKQFEDGISSGIKNALDPEQNDLDAAISVAAVAIGQAAGGQTEQAIGTALGAALGSVIPGIGTALGAVIGGAIGSIFGGDSVPKFQVRFEESLNAIDAGTDRVLQTAFGNLELAFRDVGGEEQVKIANAYAGFLQGIAGIIRDPTQQGLIADALADFGVSSRSGPESVEAQLGLVLDEVLGTFDSFTENFVNVAETLEGRLQRLVDFFAIQNKLLLGQGFGLSGDLSSFGPIGGGASPVIGPPGFGGGGGSPIEPPVDLRTFSKGEFDAAVTAIDEFGGSIQDVGDEAFTTNPVLQQTLLLLDELAIGGESLQDTFARLSSVVADLDRVAGLAGVSFADSREGLVRFGADLVALFGDDAGALNQVLNRVLEAAFSDAELDAQTIAAARQTATDLLTQLGIEVTEDTFTQAGLRELIDLLGGFDAEGTAKLIAAMDAIATIVDLSPEIADGVDDIADAAERLAEQQEFLRAVGQQALQVIAPSRAAFADLIQRLDETRARAEELGLAEGQLNIVRLSAAAQTLQLISALEQQLQTEIDVFNSVGGEAQTGAQQIGRAINNTRDQWLRAIDSIQSALDRQLVGPNSSLTNRERLDESERQLREAVQAALGGDVNAAQQIGQLFNAAIGQGAAFFGTSTDEFASLEQELRRLIGSVPANVSIPPEQQTATNTRRIADSAREREISDLERLQAAINIVDILGILNTVTGRLPSDIGAEFGIPIADVVQAITGELPDLTGDALAGFFDDLVSETNRQLNELGLIEQASIDQVRLLGGTNFLLREILEELGGSGSGGKNGGGSISPNPSIGGGEIGGPFKPGPGDGTVTGSNAELVAEVQGLRAEVREGNSDRRTAAEIETEVQERVERRLAAIQSSSQNQQLRPDGGRRL